MPGKSLQLARLAKASLRTVRGNIERIRTYHSRQIDGIVLTKFDTVSDKVGAALTMTHITGAPVAFVGTGQKYNHLKKLSVQSVIKSLFA